MATGWSAAQSGCARECRRRHRRRSRLELLLGDIRDDLRQARGNKVDRDSVSGTGRGARRDGRPPWAEYGRSEKPITPGKLARLLKPLAIAPENIRIGDKVPKGYVLERFKEAFARYLAPEGASEPLHRYNADETGTSDLFQTATAEPDVADRKCEKPNNGGPCSGVADQKGDSGDARVSCAENIATDQTCVQCRAKSTARNAWPRSAAARSGCTTNANAFGFALSRPGRAES